LATVTGLGLMAIVLFMYFSKNSAKYSLHEKSREENPLNMIKPAVRHSAIPKMLKSDVTANEHALILPGNQDRKYWHNMDTLQDVGNGFLIDIKLEEVGPVIFGDVLPKVAANVRLKDGAHIKLGKPLLWALARVPYIMDSNLKNKQEFIQAIAMLEEETGVQFVARNREEDYVAITFGKEHCYSHLGRIGGEQKIFLSETCKKSEILHELLHTLGFVHEQARPDRDDFVVIYWDNIEEKYWPQFKKIPPSYQLLPDVEFDYKSIMLYPPEAFAKNRNFASMSKQNGDLYSPSSGVLSVLDVEKIREIYQDEINKRP